MTEPTTPPPPPGSEPPPPAAEPPPAAAEPPPSPAAPPNQVDFNAMLSKFDRPGRYVLFGSLAIAALALVGYVINPYGTLIWVLLLGLIGAGLAWASTSMDTSRWPVDPLSICLGIGVVVVIVSAVDTFDWVGLFIRFEARASYILGAIISILLVLAGGAVVVGARRGRAMNAGAVTQTVMASDRGTKLAFGGLILVVVALVVGVLVSGLGENSLATGLLVGAFLFLLIPTAGAAWNIPIPPSWVAAGLAILAGVFVLGQLGYLGLGDGLTSLFFLAFVVGVVAVIAGAILSAIENYKPGMLPAMGSTSGAGSSGAAATPPPADTPAPPAPPASPPPPSEPPPAG